MAEAEHKRAVRAALRVDAELKTIFAQLGTAEHPNGRVLRAYRVARRALQATGGLRPGSVAETLAELQGAMRQIAGGVLQEAAAAGTRSARAQLEVYGLPARPTYYDTAPALTAWLAMVDSQVTAVQAAVATGAEPELVVGDDTQPGMLNPSGPTREGAKWAAIVAQGAWWGWLEAARRWAGRSGGPDELLKQAIAAIDERTTECCLLAHGQVREMDEEFELRGRPRFANALQWVPFHWYCRSSVALVRRADADDSLTRELLEAAKRELAAREREGNRVEIHPSHGRSGR